MLQLKKVTAGDAERYWRMQIEAFAELLKRYQDMDTNPGNASLESVTEALKQPSADAYFIEVDGQTVGAIRVVRMDDGVEKRISPLFVLPAYHGRGAAQAAIREVERLYGSDHWALETALQETGNCHLYEKMGYRWTGRSEVVNDRLTLILYVK